jgi:hypothetical protein
VDTNRRSWSGDFRCAVSQLVCLILNSGCHRRGHGALGLGSAHLTVGKALFEEREGAIELRIAARFEILGGERH